MNDYIDDKVVVRFPPSPTGKLHVGNVRTLVFNHLFTKKNNGKTILRIEDTDKARSKREYEDYIIESLKWLGLEYKEFYRQSDRTEVYKEFLQRMIENGNAYISEESYSKEEVAEAKKEGKELHKNVIRFKNPNKVVTFNDEILGEISVDTTDLKDFVIAKDLETPLYHLVVVIDDFLMGITHIIRGNDHIANTPRQILIQEVIGANRPIYAHLPLIIGEDGKKLSKRHGATSVLDYRDMGYERDAVLNFLAFLGWNPGTEKEVFTKQELEKEFSLSRIQKSPAVFNEKKLDWFNKKHLGLLSDKDFQRRAEEIFQVMYPNSKEIVHRLLPELRERVIAFGKLKQDLEAGEYSYFFHDTKIDTEKLVFKNSTQIDTLNYLNDVKEITENYNGIWDIDAIQLLIFPYANEKGRGNVLWPLRYSLCGEEKSPNPFTLMYVLGKNESIRRIEQAINAIK